MKASNAFVFIAVLGCSGAALADDTVKSGGNLEKPGRAVDQDTVKSGGRLDKPGREVDGDTVKSGGHIDNLAVPSTEMRRIPAPTSRTPWKQPTDQRLRRVHGSRIPRQ